MLHVHRADRADVLADWLGEALAVPAPDADPFRPEVVAVPARGVERWLAQRLSRVLGATHDEPGVCAGVRFPSSAALVADVLAAVTGVDPADDPWHPDRLVWPVLAALDDCLAEPWAAVLRHHLEARSGRRVATAARVAARFAAYHAERPALVRTWAGDGAGAAAETPEDLRWQVWLWRAVRDAIGTASPAERLGPGCEALRADPVRIDLPSRVSLFGPTRLTETDLAVLAALAEGREVHCWLPHPSDAQWRTIGAVPAGCLRADDPTALRPGHPLLASLGRDARELALRVRGLRVQRTDEHRPTPERPATLLGALQRAVAADQQPADQQPAAPHRIAPDDHSLTVHACHGPARQVEVLREVLVGLFADDPGLEPRDVVVLCPDIETYAPLLLAAFARPPADADPASVHPGHRIRAGLADRSPQRTNVVLEALAAVLRLADARCTATEVLGFAALPAVRERFALDDDDLSLLRDWTADAAVRWGRDHRHAAQWGVPTGQNTWRAGLDRLLAGVAMTGDGTQWLGLALPLDRVDSAAVELAGRFAELVARLDRTLAAMAGERTPVDWADLLGAAMDRLTATPEAEAWQGAAAAREVAEALAGSSSVRIGLEDVRVLLAERLRPRPTRAGFRTGSLTMCSLVPMRTVPHRVVCLLGFDDGAYPRTPGLDGDDLLGRAPQVGDRDLRSEDRQVLLDAVMSAEERLVVLYTGADVRTNAPRPPAVPVGELLDAVDRTATAPDGGSAAGWVVHHHPLQPTDERNFTVGALGAPRPFSFDRHALAGARAARAGQRAKAPFLAAALPAPDLDLVALADLVAFVEHPAATFFRRRLGTTTLGAVDQVREDVPAEVGGLEAWGVADRILTARLAGLAEDDARRAEFLRGLLPPGRLGSQALDTASTKVTVVLGAAADLLAVEPTLVDVATSGVPPVGGTVDQVRGDTVLRVTVSRLAPKHRLRAWVQLLALTTTDPTRPWRARTVGLGKDGAAQVRVVGPLAADVAARAWEDLLRLYVAALRAPLPMAVRTSEAYAARRSAGGSHEAALAAARAQWEGTYQVQGEHEDPVHRAVWDETPADLLAERPWPDEAWPDEVSRFGALARRLWEPLLDAERAAQVVG